MHTGPVRLEGSYNVGLHTGPDFVHTGLLGSSQRCLLSFFAVLPARLSVAYFMMTGGGGGDEAIKLQQKADLADGSKASKLQQTNIDDEAPRMPTT